MKHNLAVKPTLYALVVSFGLVSPLVLAAASTQVSNATNVKLAQIKGRVMVNTGVNYKQARSGTLLQTGAKLVTPRGASAVLVYNNGCTKNIAENSMLTIGSSAECVTNTFKEKIYVAAAPGDTVTDTPEPLVSGTGGPSPAILTWVAGLLGTVAATSNSDSNSNNPAISSE